MVVATVQANTGDHDAHLQFLGCKSVSVHLKYTLGRLRVRGTMVNRISSNYCTTFGRSTKTDSNFVGCAG